VGGLALLPPWFWDHMLGLIGAALNIRHYSRGLVLYYDADVPITRTLLSIACTFLGLRPPVLAAQTTTEEDGTNEGFSILRLVKEGHYYWVAVDPTGKRLTGHHAVIALLADTPALSPIVPLIVKLAPLFRFGYFFYSIIFALLPLEYMLSIPQYSIKTRRTTGLRLPHSLSALSKIRVTDLVVLFFCFYVVWWNIGTANTDFEMSPGLKSIGISIRLDQFWSMFAPYPMKDDGWFIIPAKLANNKEIDMFNDGEPLSYEKPQYVSKTFFDSRWRKYMMNLWSVSHQDKRLFFGRYLCRQWNWYGEGQGNNQYTLKTFKIVYMREITLPNYKVKGPDAIVLWEHQC